MSQIHDFQDLTAPRMNEAAWRAHDLLRAYAARDRAAIVEHLAHLEDDQLEFARGVVANSYNDTRGVLRDTGRPHNPITLVREVDTVARFAPAEHEFAVTTAARRLARGEAKMQEVIDVMDVRDRIHTLAVYTLALLLAVFSRKRVQNMLDTPPRRPRRSAVGRARTASRDAVPPLRAFKKRSFSEDHPAGPPRPFRAFKNPFKNQDYSTTPDHRFLT
ncbi:hypothetical protein [Streptomyces sp. CB01881]|uniref:hypothetical protein n=1 Tax=Streptomyces sp. CB01881 TaxID=2078691 RepID=UPI000CDBF2A4|nr:hypothetical protein [Streptomyces sp. CB01881]AUY53547.1 hypothetical protein C2142_37130 [Streptomyces sp. CB01881]TYC69692.1 hypothetical protein EH183_37155 [Streptomyces sp. CB01881]